MQTFHLTFYARLLKSIPIDKSRSDSFILTWNPFSYWQAIRYISPDFFLPKQYGLVQFTRCCQDCLPKRMYQLHPHQLCFSTSLSTFGDMGTSDVMLVHFVIPIYDTQHIASYEWGRASFHIIISYTDFFYHVFLFVDL